MLKRKEMFIRISSNQIVEATDIFSNYFLEDLKHVGKLIFTIN